MKLDGTYVGYWLGNSLVAPINIGKISAAGPSKKTVRLTIEGMEKLLDDIEVSLAKVAASVAAVAQARQYIGSLNDQIDMVGAKFNEIPTTLETLEVDTTSCHAMKVNLILSIPKFLCGLSIQKQIFSFLSIPKQGFSGHHSIIFRIQYLQLHVQFILNLLLTYPSFLVCTVFSIYFLGGRENAAKIAFELNFRHVKIML